MVDYQIYTAPLDTLFLEDRHLLVGLYIGNHQVIVHKVVDIVLVLHPFHIFQLMDCMEHLEDIFLLAVLHIFQLMDCMEHLEDIFLLVVLHIILSSDLIAKVVDKVVGIHLLHIFQLHFRLQILSLVDRENLHLQVVLSLDLVHKKEPLDEMRLKGWLLKIMLYRLPLLF
jgi:hypothetical protein